MRVHLKTVTQETTTHNKYFTRPFLIVFPVKNGCYVRNSYFITHIELLWSLCLLACGLLSWQEGRNVHLFFVVWFNQLRFGVNSTVIRLIVPLETINVSIRLFECLISTYPCFDRLEGSLCTVSFHFGVLRIKCFMLRSVYTLLKAIDRNSCHLQQVLIFPSWFWAVYA